MRFLAIARVIMLSAALAAFADHLPAAAAGPQAVGSGVVRTGGAAAFFTVELDETQMVAFAYVDYSEDPPRMVSMSDWASVDCLGELFSGQTMRLTGAAFDSTLPGEPVTLQLFLVDGGDSAFDQLSLKVRRSDGTEVYQAYLRPLDSGGLTISCAV